MQKAVIVFHFSFQKSNHFDFFTNDLVNNDLIIICEQWSRFIIRKDPYEL